MSYFFRIFASCFVRFSTRTNRNSQVLDDKSDTQRSFGCVCLLEQNFDGFFYSELASIPLICDKRHFSSPFLRKISKTLAYIKIFSYLCTRNGCTSATRAYNKVLISRNSIYAELSALGWCRG